MINRRLIGIGALVGSLLVWVIVIGLVLIDVVTPPPVPTPLVIRTLPVDLTPIAAVSTIVPATNVPSATVLASAPPLPSAVPATETPFLSLTASNTAAPPTDLPTASPTDSPIIATTGAPNTTIPVIANETPGCVPPAGWSAYHVIDGDTLFGFQLGSGGTITVDAIMKANCLTGKILTLGQLIYLPPGVGQKAPKLDDSGGAAGGGTPLPVGLTRTAHCPCTAVIHLGLRREQVAALIDNLPVGFTGGDFLAVTGPNAPTAGFSFLADKPAGASLEGFLFPGSYTVQNTTSALDFRNQLLSAFDAAIPTQWRNDVGAHGLNLYQAVTFASIVQRESRDPVDQTNVASTMYNLIAAGKGLGATPTVQYIFGHPGAWWPNVGAAELASTSRYNTYHYLGLPPTPIDSPDQNAIRATIYPAQTNYLYFAGCNGVNVYAATYDQFVQQIKSCN
jgi:hypothetical protein